MLMHSLRTSLGRAKRQGYTPETARKHRAWAPRAGARAIVAALIAFSSFSLQAAENDAQRFPVTSPLPMVGDAEPISAWRDFCVRYPTECAVDLSEPAVVELTAAAWGAIHAVNELVNSTTKAVVDIEHWGMVDRWDFPTDGYGDCEDYQLLKRRLLVELGIPRRSMRITVVIDETREGHAVLMIRTERGDYILDNRRDAVLAWSNTGYEYIKREGSEGRMWVALNGEKGAVTVASR
jgi:predicted transglutaminase-like cysteine proteinase